MIIQVEVMEAVVSMSFLSKGRDGGSVSKRRGLSSLRPLMSPQSV